MIYFSERRGDKTLPNFRKGKHPRKAEKKKQGAGHTRRKGNHKN